MPFRILVSLVVLGLLLAALLILPLVWPVPPLEGTRSAEDLAGPDAVWLAADELRLHATVRTPPQRSAGVPAFVFVHGFASHGRSFVPLLETLGERSPAIAYDRPGFGLSERPQGGWDRNPYGHAAQVDQVLTALDRLGAQRAVLVGSSAGGGITLRTALEHPARVAGLVLLAPDVSGAGAPSWNRPLLHTPQLDRIGPLLMRQLGGESGDALYRSAYADPSRIEPAMLEARREGTSVHDWDRGLWEVTQVGRAPDPTGRLDEVEVPVLVLSGDADAIVPPEDSRALAATLPSAHYEELPGCGHLIHEECPEAVAASIGGWLVDTGLAGERRAEEALGEPPEDPPAEIGVDDASARAPTTR